MSQGRYVWIAGKKVYLNPELQKEWDKLINKERYRARQEKICGQADYRRCNGDYGQGSALSPASNAEVYKRTSEYILRFLMWHYFRFRRIICCL
jgi:hypothetical protein